MNIRTTLALFAFCFAFSLSAQDLLTHQDSVFMYANEGGVKYVQHPIKKGQTLYSISKFYALSVDEIYYYNPQLGNTPTLEVGQRINVPVPNPSICRFMKKGMKKTDFAKIYYTVQPGETLYNISKNHFGMDVEAMKKRNNLESSSIKVGQLLFVGWFTCKGIKPEWRGDAPEESATAALGEVLKESGVAAWQHNSTEKSAAMHCLHDSAKIGSKMAVTFSVTKKRVFVTVIGRMPVNAPDNVKLVLSPGAARALGAKDPRILVDMEYVE